MSQGSFVTTLLPTAARPAEVTRQELAAIDRSVRFPVLVFFASAIFWLVVSSVLALITSIQLNHPSFLDSIPFLTYGRLRPAQFNSMVYGWASAGGIGVAVWLMARLCGVVMKYRAILTTAAVFWNLGILIGVLSILSGYSTSIEWLEFPGFASIFLFVAYSFIAIWGIIMFRFRNPSVVYVSQWYLLAALICFPWLYASANVLLIWNSIQASAQGPINWWYAQSAMGLWLTPIALASIYYFIPKITGQPIRSYRLSILAFWSLLLLYGWSGMRYLIGGPIPAWMVSVSVVACILLIIPVVIIGINHHATMHAHSESMQWSPTLRFTVFGASAFTLLGFQTAFMSIPTINKVLQFTEWMNGHSALAIYAFYTMTLFGAMYYIVPRLLGTEWLCSGLIRWHFWTTAIGITCVVLCLCFGGVIQGLALDDHNIVFIRTIEYVTPFRLLAAFSGLFVILGNLVFALHFALLLLKEKPEDSLAASHYKEGVRI